MTSDLLAAFKGSRTFQHIFSFHNDTGCGWPILLPDLQKDPLQSLLPFLFFVVREEVQLHITGLQVSRHYAESAYVQARVYLFVKSI